MSQRMLEQPKDEDEEWRRPRAHYRTRAVQQMDGARCNASQENSGRGEVCAWLESALSAKPAKAQSGLTPQEARGACMAQSLMRSQISLCQRPAHRNRYSTEPLQPSDQAPRTRRSQIERLALATFMLSGTWQKDVHFQRFCLWALLHLFEPF